MRASDFIQRMARLISEHGNVEVLEHECGDPADVWFDFDVRDGIIYVG